MATLGVRILEPEIRGAVMQEIGIPGTQTRDQEIRGTLTEEVRTPGTITTEIGILASETVETHTLEILILGRGHIISSGKKQTEKRLTESWFAN